MVDGYIRDSCFDIEQTVPSDLNGLLLKFVHAESIHNLVKKRMKLDDDDKIFEIDEHIVHTICCWNFLDVNEENHEETLREILIFWALTGRYHMNDCRECIIESIKWCIKRDDVGTLRVMLSYFFHSDKDRMKTNAHNIQFVNIASRYGSLNCFTLLLDLQIDWSEETEPICLENAVKHQGNDRVFINYVFGKLSTKNTSFKCNKLMQYVIENDLAAKRLLDYGWHELSEKNKLQAQSLGLECQGLFSKLEALNYYSEIDEKDGADAMDNMNWKDALDLK